MFTGTAGKLLLRSDEFRRRGDRPLSADPIRLDVVTLPATLMGKAEDVNSIATLMRPAFTVVWREGGIATDPNFDNQGNYKPNRV